jgi:glutathionyl-hydroquinone reductase
MGLLADGQWTDRWYDTSASRGRFQKSALGSPFRLESCGPADTAHNQELAVLP